MKLRVLGVLAFGVAASACSDKAESDFPTATCAKLAAQNCVEIAPGDVAALTDYLNDGLGEGSTIVLGAGRYLLETQLTVPSVKGVSIIGQGMDETTLDFGPMKAAGTQGNGVYAVGTDSILVQDFTVIDAVKDGIRIESSDGVTFRRIRTTWTNEGDSNNGAYGIYPVKVRNVLVEDSVAENASDAGLYVGQCMYAIVRNNVVRGNVAGLEIENTQYADVYGNLAEDNTGGIVVFDLPGNPIVGRDVRLRDNVIRNNNRKNFAPQGVVKEIPAGTGTFAMASRRVEITGNTYENNNTVDIAVINGLVVDTDPMVWNLATSTLLGNWDDLGLPVGLKKTMIPVLDENGDPVFDDKGNPVLEWNGEIEPDDTMIGNYRSDEILIANNTHSGSGTKPDVSVQFGLGLKVLFGKGPIRDVLYDVLGESGFNPDVQADNTNDNHVCVGGNPAGTFATVNLSVEPIPQKALFDGDRAPFDCDSLTAGPVAEVVLAGE